MPCVLQIDNILVDKVLIIQRLKHFGRCAINMKSLAKGEEGHCLP